MNVNDTIPLTRRDVAALRWMVDSIAWCRNHGYYDSMHDELADMILYRLQTDIDRLKASAEERRKKWRGAHLRLVSQRG